MTRAFLIVALLVGGAFASGGDTLRWPVDLRNVQDGDTFFVSRHIAPLRDSTQSVINGRLGNVNIAANANIGQDKIDSTGTGWLYRYGKKFTRWAGELLSFRSARGISVFVNDTTANSQPFSIISDSSDTVAKFSEGGVVLKKGLTGTTASFSGNIGADSIAGTKFNSGQGWTEIYLQDQNHRTTDDVVFDSLSLTDLRVADDVTIVDRMTVSGIATLDSVVAGDVGADSVGCTKINTGNGWVEAYPMNQDVQSTASPSFVNGTFTGTLGVSGAATIGDYAISHLVKGATQLNANTNADALTAVATSSSNSMRVADFVNLHNNVDVNPTIGYPIIRLSRQGGSGVYSSYATFDIARYENVSSNSRAELSIKLSHTNGTADAEVLRLRSDQSVYAPGALSCASLSTTGNATVGSLTTDTLSGITTIAGDWYKDTSFACTLSRAGYTSTLSYNATYKDSIGTCRIVKTGANYNMYLYGFSAMVSASGFGLLYLKTALPTAWRPNETYSGMIGDNGGTNFATWTYDPVNFKIMFSFETGNSMWLTGHTIAYTR